MRQIADAVQKILDGVLVPLEICSYLNRRGKASGYEYVIYRVSPLVRTGYAGNAAVWGRVSVDVSYYADGGKYNEQRMNVIIGAMERVGWRLFSGPFPLWFDDETEGVTMEFIHEGVIQAGTYLKQ